MAKTRLNNAKRNILKELADQTVEAMPCAELDELNTAKKKEDAAFITWVEALTEAVKTKYPEREMKIVEKYFSLNQFSNIAFTLSDKQGVALEYGYELGNRRLTQYLALKGITTTKRTEKYVNKLPRVASDRYRVTLPLNESQEAAFKAYKEAKEEACILEQKHTNAIAKVRHDFYALIEGSTNYEAVLEVWPEAEAVRDQIAPRGTALSVLSDDAVVRIRTCAKTVKQAAE